MNRQQKEIQQVFLNNEKEVLEALKDNYQDALEEINSKIEGLMARQDADMQHVIYQVEYQKSLKGQIEAIIEQLHSNNFESVSEYITKSYEDGFVGTMYDLQGQGIPLIIPIDQEAVSAAIQHETKLSANLYASFGKDLGDLKKKISGEISRGIATGQMFSEIARNISGYARISRNNAARIARTEGHRIQNRAAMNACGKAKEKGADVVKQWDASLDKKTRKSHRKVDGEIRELDEPFSNGLMYPGDPNGGASEVINCRCALLQRARWALGNDFTKWDSEEGIVSIKAKDYADFKNKYNEASKRVRSSTQKINEKRKTTEGIFRTCNITNSDSIRPRSIVNEINKSDVGKGVMEYLSNENVNVNLCYGIDNPEDLYGVYDSVEDEINVFCDKTKTIKETAKTIIHEATHRKQGSEGTFAEEVECYKAEILHEKGELTTNDIDNIIKLVEENYPDLK